MLLSEVPALAGTPVVRVHKLAYSAADIHVDAFLTNFSIDYQVPETLIADLVMPLVKKASNRYPVWKRRDALRTAAARRFELYALAQVDAANLLRVQGRLRANAGPLVRLRSQAIAWNTDTQGNATALAQSMNDARVQLVWAKRAEDLSAVGAAAWAARRAVREAGETNIPSDASMP